VGVLERLPAGSVAAKEVLYGFLGRIGFKRGRLQITLWPPSVGGIISRKGSSKGDGSILGELLKRCYDPREFSLGGGFPV